LFTTTNVCKYGDQFRRYISHAHPCRFYLHSKMRLYGKRRFNKQKSAKKKRRETEGGGPEIYISALNWKKRFKLWEDVLVLKRTFFLVFFLFLFNIYKHMSCYMYSQAISKKDNIAFLISWSISDNFSFISRYSVTLKQRLLQTP